jgi:hypothetical protein
MIITRPTLKHIIVTVAIQPVIALQANEMTGKRTVARQDIVGGCAVHRQGFE